MAIGASCSHTLLPPPSQTKSVTAQTIVRVTESAHSPARVRAVVTVLAGAAIAGALIAVRRPDAGDYARLIGGNPDNPGEAIWALAHLHFARASGAQPLMGASSLVLRAPFAAIGDALGGIRLEYLLGAFACVWPLAVLALAVGAQARRRHSLLIAAATAAFVVLAPSVTQAISVGHPEELLLAATATGGAWAAARSRAIAAGALTGTAIGTLPFGIAALIAAALATRASRATTLAVAVLVGLLLVAPLPLSAPHTYLDRNREIANAQRVYPQSLWWWAGHDRALRVDLGGGDVAHTTVRMLPGGVDRGTALIVAAGLGLAAAGLALARARGGALGYDALALLAVLFLLRSAFDPKNLEYYLVPAIVALIAWEVLARARPPIVALAASALEVVIFRHLRSHDALAATAFMLWFGALAGYLLAASRKPVRQTLST